MAQAYGLCAQSVSQLGGVCGVIEETSACFIQHRDALIAESAQAASAVQSASFQACEQVEAMITFGQADCVLSSACNLVSKPPLFFFYFLCIN